MMSSETDQFLKFRPNLKYIEEVKHLPNHNYKTTECDKMSGVEAKETSGSIVKGWLVGNINHSTDWYCSIQGRSVSGTPIIRHTWNINNNGEHYDTVDYRQSDKFKNFQYVMDPNVDVIYNINNEIYIPGVFFLTDGKLGLRKKNGVVHMITKEEHERFYNEIK